MALRGKKCDFSTVDWRRAQMALRIPPQKGKLQMSVEWYVHLWGRAASYCGRTGLAGPKINLCAGATLAEWQRPIAAWVLQICIGLLAFGYKWQLSPVRTPTTGISIILSFPHLTVIFPCLLNHNLTGPVAARFISRGSKCQFSHEKGRF